MKYYFLLSRFVNTFNTSLIDGNARSPDVVGVDSGPLDLFDHLGFIDDVDSFSFHSPVEIKHGTATMVGIF